MNIFYRHWQKFRLFHVRELEKRATFHSVFLLTLVMK